MNLDGLGHFQAEYQEFELRGRREGWRRERQMGNWKRVGRREGERWEESQGWWGERRLRKREGVKCYGSSRRITKAFYMRKTRLAGQKDWKAIINRWEEKAVFPRIPTFVGSLKISPNLHFSRNATLPSFMQLYFTPSYHSPESLSHILSFHQSSELLKLRLNNNNALAGAFQIYFGVLWIPWLDFAGTQRKVLSFGLVL